MLEIPLIFAWADLCLREVTCINSDIGGPPEWLPGYSKQWLSAILCRVVEQSLHAVCRQCEQ